MAVVVAVVGCSGGEELPKTGTMTAPASRAPVTETVVASPMASATPTITFRERKSASKDPFPSSVNIAEPRLNGVPPNVAEAFAAAFEANVAREMDIVDETRSSYAHEGADCAFGGTSQGVSLKGTTITSAIYAGTASVSTLFTVWDGCDRPMKVARSIAIDVSNGARVRISDIVKAFDEGFQESVLKRARRECADISFGSDEDDQQIDFPAFTPTPSELVLTWTNADFLPWSCGVVTIKVPWSEAPAPGDDAMSESECPADAKLPAGIDPRVCGPAPAAAITPNRHYDSYTLASPSGNILCDLTTTSAACVIEKHDFAPIPEGPMPDTPEVGAWRPDYVSVERVSAAGAWTEQPTVAEIVAWGEDSGAKPLHLDDVGVLPYTKAAAVGSMACVSQEIGMSCWNVGTKHGFFLARERYVIWEESPPSASATAGTIYGMQKTTIYLPEDLKRAVEAKAARTGQSEAEVIRGAIRAHVSVERPKPRGGLFRGTEPIADNMDEALKGFGSW